MKSIRRTATRCHLAPRECYLAFQQGERASQSKANSLITRCKRFTFKLLHELLINLNVVLVLALHVIRGSLWLRAISCWHGFISRSHRRYVNSSFSFHVSHGRRDTSVRRFPTFAHARAQHARELIRR
jgi:hypothetical protein